MNPLQLHFHVKTGNSRLLSKLLQQLSGVGETKRSRLSTALTEIKEIGAKERPSYLIVNKSNREWYCIRYNSYEPLYQWGEVLSAELNTLFIQAAYRERDRYTYFLAYDRGKKVREILATGGCEIPVKNEGILFPFENPHADGVCGSEITMFDLESLADYCMGCGIDIDNLQQSYFSTVLAGCH